MSFDKDRFVADCVAAVEADPSHKLVREVVARAVSEPGELMRALGEPTRAQAQKLYASDKITILNLVWGPGMMVSPHDHTMWAVIGLYSGREDNIFWRRRDDGRALEAAGVDALFARDTVPLGRDIIHSVTNPLRRFTGAIHVYGGDFYAAERSEWDAETMERGPFDMARAARLFEESNGRGAKG
jgi:predicted metal-dependent enzyme (double-stranded beta helix superfamily)